VKNGQTGTGGVRCFGGASGGATRMGSLVLGFRFRVHGLRFEV
jgi:hypothetical protein